MSVVGQNILAGTSANQVAYTIDQSLRFSDGDNGRLSRTPSSAGDRRTFTISCWVKRGSKSAACTIFGDAGADKFAIHDDYIALYLINGSIGAYLTQFTTLIRDPAAWYHIVYVVDTTQATDTDRLALYLNGEKLTPSGTPTYPSQNAETGVNNNALQEVGAVANAEDYDGYLADIYLIDGTALTPSSFAEVNEDTNQWTAIQYGGSYGTNGFHLKFEDSADLGNDSSGNGNDYTVANLAATDQVLDTPSNNWCTLNSVTKMQNSSSTLAEGNLQATTTAANWNGRMGTMGVSSGKWYWEIYQKTMPTNNIAMCGIVGDSDDQAWAGNSDPQGGSESIAIYGFDGNKFVDGSDTGGYGVSYTAGDIIGVALNMTDSELTIYKNNVAMNSGTAISFSGGVATANSISPLLSGYGATGVMVANFGQDSSFAGNKTAQGNQDGNDIGDFYYTPPTGYLALCSSNLADPSIILSGEHFNSVLYTGNGTSLAVTGVGFQPDMVTVKSRTAATSNYAYDVLRGAGERMVWDGDYEQSSISGVTSFDADGFTVGTETGNNLDTGSFVGWSWKLGGASPVTNTDGDITSYNTVNSTAGMSLSKYSGLGPGGSTFGHGLAVAPTFVMIKGYDGGANQWYVWRLGAFTADNYTVSLQSNGNPTETGWNASVNPTSSVVKVANSSAWNASGYDFIAWCMYDIDGFSKTGIYNGNGNADGTFIYTGFKPAFFICRNIAQAEGWELWDSVREPYNKLSTKISPNTADAEYTANTTTYAIDFLSNGVKLRTTYSAVNSAHKFLYIAFAENPFKYSNAR